MYPNYRTTAADRRNKLALGCLVAGIVVLVVGTLGLIAGELYVSAHFVAKYW